MPLAGDPAAGGLEHDCAAEVDGASGRWQRLGLGAEHQPLGGVGGNGPVLVPVSLVSSSATRSSAARLRG
jgi:hypothetical protein